MAKKEPKEEPVPAGKPQKSEDENPDFKFLVRIVNTDIEGEMPLYLALPKVKGIGRRVSIRIVDNLEFDRYQRIGDMTDEEVDKIQHALENIHDILPHWMMNRQKDYDSGDDIHVTSSEVQMTRRDDINRLKKVRAYRGIRHERGHKVRGQRLKSNGRTGLVLGVSRKRR
ncbi:MAG: 30S ribosomal protein S13 [Candidatus Thermoplasmatota archaeon]|nr:30S ribosomal protein S13 [Candidatus Thermoplasmatota archaeon]